LTDFRQNTRQSIHEVVHVIQADVGINASLLKNRQEAIEVHGKKPLTLILAA
jgi:hypothetical protein